MILLSQDVGRSPMAPAWTATSGVKGSRPTAHTGDRKNLLYVFAVVNPLSAASHTNTPESPGDAKKQTGKSKMRPRQERSGPACITSTPCGLKESIRASLH